MYIYDYFNFNRLSEQHKSEFNGGEYGKIDEENGSNNDYSHEFNNQPDLHEIANSFE
jgi:hypothetical protein